MIVVKDLKKDYDEEGTVTSALRGISFNIEKGEFVSIIGPSGSGKSTLLQILSFLDRPTGGSYTFFGKSIDNMKDEELARVRNKDMGFVFQAFNLLSRLTVFDNVEIPLLYSDLPAGEREDRITKAVESVGLIEKLRTETAKLSGGQKQRIAIARALVNNPNIIFADEPTGNLDSQSGAQVMGILDDLNSKGHTVVLVTHETYTAEFADRIIKMRDGTMESDTPVAKPRRSKDQFFK
ncbi:MAG TPA: ABC transporter ATP-binding protein [Candidatus Paceibacterota bacterium]|jgi:putative ABC transport system ATP-binding protein|nr:ABC transporter ATP-binding protein [Candidatus Paceibacterota bacterium]